MLPRSKDIRLKSSSIGAFTMTEVLIAAVLFIVAASGVLGTMVQTRKPAIDSDRNAQAAMYAQKVIETLRASLGADTWSSASWSPNTYNFPADAQFPGFTATYTISNLADGGKQVVVNVTY